MRLINCSTLQLEEFIGENIPKYAILSHTWGNEEVSFADFTLGQTTATTRGGYQKISLTCKQAIRDGLRYAWVDTCCIDKSSSAELSEAINSMFAWYKKSAKCYAYLSDVSEANFEKSFPKSRWFTRGWTLQELLAPQDVIFYDRAWEKLGTKLEHIDKISDITAIDREALKMKLSGFEIGMKFDSFCVAKRMSWASSRKTTRTEDMAYCLLGIFNINMPLLYGEGKRAFIRLQEEIIKTSNDNSILAWGLRTEMLDSLGRVPALIASMMENNKALHIGPILANSPKDFYCCGGLEYAGQPNNSAFTMTNLGLDIQLPLVPVSQSFQNRETGIHHPLFGWIGLLNCSLKGEYGFIGIFLISNEKLPDSNKILKRAGIMKGFPWKHFPKDLDWTHLICRAMVVGPRAGMQAVTEKITIVKDNNNQGKRMSNIRFPEAVVNESKALQDMGYRLTSGTGFIENHQLIYRSWWDPAAMSLTRKANVLTKELLAFCFEPQWSGSNMGFTIFIGTGSWRAIVREGTNFSENDKHYFYKYLEDQSQQDCVDDITVRGNHGTPFGIKVTIQKNTVYGWEIFEVNVDAIRLTARLSMQEEPSVQIESRHAQGSRSFRPTATEAQVEKEG